MTLVGLYDDGSRDSGKDIEIVSVDFQVNVFSASVPTFTFVATIRSVISFSFRNRKGPP